MCLRRESAAWRNWYKTNSTDRQMLIVALVIWNGRPHPVATRARRITLTMIRTSSDNLLAICPNLEPNPSLPGEEERILGIFGQ